VKVSAVWLPKNWVFLLLHTALPATFEEFAEAVKTIGMPCVVKPIMSSSGHGQSVIRKEEDIKHSWEYAQEGGRAGAGKVIVEGFVNFDYEITQLTVRHINGTSFCEPIGHVQVDGDYRESWQPQAMTLAAREKAREIATKITDALGGRGIFGVELFIKGDDVIFSEVSPRPHDTGMVTMISQDLSQFALHARAVLGLPVPNITFHGPSASRAVVVEGDSNQLQFGNLENVLSLPDTQMRFFRQTRSARTPPDGCVACPRSLFGRSTCQNRSSLRSLGNYVIKWRYHLSVHGLKQRGLKRCLLR
jgi:phosphoribosylglycinamide formyltransferase 2